MSGIIARVWAGALGCCWGLVSAGSASASPRQTPDIITYDVGVDGNNTNDIHYWGQDGGIAAYSIATQACNSGTRRVNWITVNGSTLHPVIGQNMFRLANGRFEQIGQSWLKHGFCSVNAEEAECFPCQTTGCDRLGIGCADTYFSQLNDGQDGQSKKNVNAATGAHVHGGHPTGNATIRGRLQVAVADISLGLNPGAEYFIEGQYVAEDDAGAGASANNASWRRVNRIAVNNVDGGGPTMREEPAIFAWQSMDPGVEIKTVENIEDAGGLGAARGVKTVFYLAFRVTNLGGGEWNYEYALHNLNSDQSAGSYSVPVHPTVSVTNVGFHDVAYHSGDPYDGTDWPGLRSGGEIRWATAPFDTNANANAVRWGTLYNFRFDANSPPVRGPVTIGLFKPSLSTDIVVPDVLVPMDAPPKHVRPHGPPRPLIRPDVSPTVARNGSGVNLLVLAERSPAIVGRTWRASIELDGVDDSILFVSLAGPTEGVFNSFGEMLIQAPINRMSGGLALPIPLAARLFGVPFSVQAAVHSSSGWMLTNALDVTIGSSN